MQTSDLPSFRLGLIGYPLGHSLSPRIHEAALKSCGLEGSYALFPIQPNDKQSLKGLLARVRNGEINGLNVTIPHKQNVIPYLDELTPTAQSIGAVNTIYLWNNRLIGDNTDAAGFLTDMKKFLNKKTPQHGESGALVLGAGGSARAVVYALLNDGWNITISARRFQQAQHLADSFANHKPLISVFELSMIEANLWPLLSNLSLIINTTPLGMAPNGDQSPWPKNLPFPPHAAIYDLVYNPRDTKLVRDACLQGLPATTGLGMLVEQAALAFEIWTGSQPSRQALLNELSQTEN